MRSFPQCEGSVCGALVETQYFCVKAETPPAPGLNSRVRDCLKPAQTPNTGRRIILSQKHSAKGLIRRRDIFGNSRVIFRYPPRQGLRLWVQLNTSPLLSLFLPLDTSVSPSLALPSLSCDLLTHIHSLVINSALSFSLLLGHDGEARIPPFARNGRIHSLCPRPPYGIPTCRSARSAGGPSECRSDWRSGDCGHWYFRRTSLLGRAN